MKIYHDHNEDDSWTEITTIKSYPQISPRLDETTQISFVLYDFEGALYSTWSGYNFIPIKVEDDSSNILFRGYLTGKKFKHNQLSCIAHGLSVKFDWTPFSKNYVLAEGLIKTVPSTTHFPSTQPIYPDNDTGQTWTITGGGTSHDAVKTIDDGLYITAGDVANRGIEEIYDCETLTVTSVSAITLKVYGKYITTSRTLIGQIWDDVGGAWEATKNFDFTDEYSWVEQTWDGLAYDQDNMDALKIKLKAAADYENGDYTRIEAVEIEVTYIGLTPEAIDVTDSDGDAFTTWTADQWHQNQDTAILIRDTSDNWSSTVWTCSAVVAANEDSNAGNAASVQTAYDDNYFQVLDTGGIDATATMTISGAGIDSVTKKLKSIKLNYNIGTLLAGNPLDCIKYAKFQIRYNTTDWKTIWGRQVNTGDGLYFYKNGEHTITGTNAELAKYLTKTLDNYTAIEQIRVVLSYKGDVGATAGIRVDYLKATISYYDEDISPITEEITDNGTSSIVCEDVDWEENGVNGESAPGEADGDSFIIGVSTDDILNDIAAEAEVGITIDTTLTKYIGQNFKGTYCKEILKKVCLLEGLHWWEDYTNNRVILAAEADFTDSAVDLTQADYGYDWEFEDDGNYYSAVEVFGSAGYNIYYKTPVDTSIDSPRTKTIIEETIMTIAEAKEVADNMLTELSTKQPSIKIPLNGVNSSLTIGKTVGLTMVRPTGAEADYPIRMIERSKFGAGIKTIIYCGLGHSTDKERIADIINKIAYLSHKAHTDRLISTNFAPGASITWSDVGGAQTAVESIITTEVGGGQSIDNAIDTLIATHTADDDAHHAIPAECERLTPMYLLGDAGFTATLGRWEVAHSDVDARINANWVAHKTATYKVQMAHYSTVAARTDSGTLHVGIMQTTDTYSVSNEINAENYDLVNTVINTVYLTDSTSSFSVTKGDIITARFTKDNAAGTGTLRVIGMYLVEQ